MGHASTSSHSKLEPDVSGRLWDQVSETRFILCSLLSVFTGIPTTVNTGWSSDLRACRHRAHEQHSRVPTLNQPIRGSLIGSSKHSPTPKQRYAR